MRICVFCGSNAGDDPAFLAAAVSVAALLARRDIGLVYGGGRVGLMGALADAMLEVGGEVIGIIPEALAGREIAHTGLSDLRIVGTMHERKALMAALADAFLTLPGGFGTLEELFEIVTWRQLGYHAKPFALLNVSGYFDPLLAFCDAAVAHGFAKRSDRERLLVGNDAATLIDRLVGDG